MTDNTFTRVDPLMVHDALLYGPHRQDAADYVCAALRAAYAEIDRLRANALTWTTVTDDPATLPEDGDRVILRSVEWTGDSGAWSEAEYNKWPDGDDGWVVCIDTYEETLDVRPGDRWAYIPEAPHADN